MTAEELRIGNYYHLYHIVDKLDERGEYDEICKIDADDFRILENFDCPEYKPIPLTEEWLLKFGFEGKINETSQCGNFYLGYDAEYGRHRMSLWYQKGSWCFSHTNTFTVLKYVHQLQNLYFALTGEELIVSSNRD